MAIEPIVLTRFGETMIVEFPPPWTEDKLTDEHPLQCSTTYIGIHESDKGFIYFRPVSKTHGIIHCAVCGRITGPLLLEGINTYGKLRDWCAKEIQAMQIRNRNLNWIVDSHSLIG